MSDQSENKKMEEAMVNVSIFDQLLEMLFCIHHDKDVEHILETRNVLWTAHKRLKDIYNDRVEKGVPDDYRTLTDIEQTLTYMIDNERCFGDDYTAVVLQDLKDKYW